MKSLKLMSFKNKKPLINGFEFGVEADLNAAVFHSRKGKLNIKQTLHTSRPGLRFRDQSSSVNFRLAPVFHSKKNQE